jgi:hypothetical protein
MVIFRILLCLICAPLLALIVIALKIESRRAPALVRQNGRLRFRANGPTIGRVLQASRLDEMAEFLDITGPPLPMASEREWEDRVVIMMMLLGALFLLDFLLLD